MNSPVEALVIEGKTVAWGWELAMSGDSLVRYESSDGINFQKTDIPVFINQIVRIQVGIQQDHSEIHQ